MSATQQQLAIIGNIGMDVEVFPYILARGCWTKSLPPLQHVTYIVIMFCMGFVIYLWSNLLISLYHNSGCNSRKADGDDTSRPGSSLWQILVSEATSQFGNGSLEPKVADYNALPSAIRSDDSIELGNSTMFDRSAALRTLERNVFDTDVEAREIEDDGDDSYWDQHDYDDEDSQHIR